MNRDPLLRKKNYLIPSLCHRGGDDPIFALNAEARRRAAAGESIINATLGALTEDSGQLAVLPSVIEAFDGVSPQAAASYAPIAGTKDYLRCVVSDLFGDSPLGEHTAAVATPGGSGALSLAMSCFLEPGQAVLVPNYFWEPYLTMASHIHRSIQTYEMFDSNLRFNVEAFAQGLENQLAKQGRAFTILNFPCNNPTGYSLDAAEWAAVTDAVGRAARLGPIVVLIDHAYARFGAPGSEAWVDHIPALSESAQVLTAWTASKSFAQYGSRVGALVATTENSEEKKEVQGALAYGCRGTWSNCNHRGMLAVASILSSPELRDRVNKERAHLVKSLADRVAMFNRTAESAGVVYPRYDGGFFVSIFSKDGEATAKGMRDDGIFVVPLKGAVRIALCSTAEADIPRLVESLGRHITEPTRQEWSETNPVHHNQDAEVAREENGTR